jgi:hypothetical protein
MSNENLIRQWRAARREYRRATLAAEIEDARAQMRKIEARMTPKQREQLTATDVAVSRES